MKRLILKYPPRTWVYILGLLIAIPALANVIEYIGKPGEDFVALEGEYQYQGLTCKSSTTNQPPFGISATYGFKRNLFENLRSPRNFKAFAKMSQGTLVTPLRRNNVVSYQMKRGHKYLMVQVNNRSPRSVTRRLTAMKWNLDNIKHLAVARTGEIGLMYNRSIVWPTENLWEEVNVDHPGTAVQAHVPFTRAKDYSFVITGAAKNLLIEKKHFANTDNKSTKVRYTLEPGLVDDDFADRNYLSLVTASALNQDGKERRHYLVHKCCRASSGSEKSPYCENHYFFHAIPKQRMFAGPQSSFASAKRIRFNPLDHETLQYLQPVRQDHIGPLFRLSQHFSDLDNRPRGIDDLVILNIKDQSVSKTNAKHSNLSLVQFEFNSKKRGPYNTKKYHQDDKVGSDNLAAPLSLCAFTQTLKEFENACKNKFPGEKGCQAHLGNMFFQKGRGKHSEHNHGECFDLLPFRKNSDSIAYRGCSSRSTKDAGKLCDEEKNKLFIDIANKHGGDVIFSMYNNAKKKHYNNRERKKLGIRHYTGRKTFSMHKNHIHLCYFTSNHSISRVRSYARERRLNYDKIKASCQGNEHMFRQKVTSN